MTSLLVICSGVFLLTSLVNAQQDDIRPRLSTVTANGEAVIIVEPDQAELDIGVVAQANNAPDAAKESADKLSRVLSEMKKLLAAKDEVKTISYSLNPNYRYPQGGKPEIVGYTAINILRLKTTNLTAVARLIDRAMQSGVNHIGRLAFTLKDEHGAQLRALRLASEKARAKAEAMAGALGLKIVRIVSLNEAERGLRPIVMPLARAGQVETLAAPSTPIETGTIEVRSSVVLTAEIGPK
jgi:uncharacterized protein YggE